MPTVDAFRIVYHEGCADGYGAAWAAWLRLVRGELLPKEKVEFIPGNFDTLPEEIRARGDTLYIIDVSYQPKYIYELASLYKKVVLIDHHQTAEEWHKSASYPDNVQINHDKEFSGAILAWKYFWGDAEIPEILKYIQDRDLWKWELANSEEVLAGLDAHGYKSFEQFTYDAEHLDELYAAGAAIVTYENSLLDTQVETHHWVKVGKYTVPAANVSIRALVSKTGHRLCKMYPEAPFAFLYRRDPNGKWNISLRSEGKFNVAEFANTYAGGGGHPNAAGMTIDTLPPMADQPVTNRDFPRRGPGGNIAFK